MLFGKGHNGADADAVAGLLRGRQAVRAEFHRAAVGGGDFEHEPGFRDAGADDASLLRRQFFAGLDGVFQGVGKHGGQFGGVHRQRVGNDQAGFHGDLPLPGLVEKDGEDGVQDHVPAEPLAAGFVQGLLGRANVLQHGGLVVLLDQGSHGLESVAQVVALNGQLFLRAAYLIGPALHHGCLGLQDVLAFLDFDDRRQVADIILSQVQATAERVSFEWKI